MVAKPQKIAVVLGQIRHTRLMQIYEPLLSIGSVDIHVIDDERILREAKTSCRLVVYPDLLDMPGYMRGLEEQLQDCDLIIAAETSSLAAFQAVRVARKEQVASLIVCDEYRPLFYAGYPNIRAIQSDVLEHATVFASSSQLARAALQIEGVGNERLHDCRHSVDVGRFKASAEARSRFRKYIGLTDDDIVIAMQENLQSPTRALELIQAVRLCVTLKPELASRLRLLLIGDGAQAKDLKYASFDHGLGRQVMFMHQNCEPFLQDLYSAVDVLVHLRHQSPDVHESFPLHLLEAAGCGAIPVVSTGTIAAEVLANVAVILSDDNFQALALQLINQIQDNTRLAQKRASVASFVATNFSPEATSQPLLTVVNDLLQTAKATPRKISSFADEITRYENLLRDGRPQDTMIVLEEAILRHTLPSARSELMRLKGEALTRSGRAEDAIQAYTESLQLNDTNAQSYKALGYLSLQSHAHEEAVTFFKKALAHNPDDANSLMGVGLVYRRLGLPDESLHWFETAIQKTETTTAVGSFVQVCLECLDANRALAAVERALDIKGDLSPLMVAKGQLLIKVGRTAEGHELLQKALNGEPGSSAA